MNKYNKLKKYLIKKHNAHCIRNERKDKYEHDLWV